TGSDTITTDDVTRGYVENTATASGTAPGGQIESPPSSATTPLGGRTGLALTKTVDDAVTYRVGQSVVYEYVVTNVGTAPVTGVSLADDHLTGIVCGTTTLAAADEPGDSTVCRGTYVVTAADAAAGSVTNVATASGNVGAIVSPPSDSTITVATPSPSPSPTPTPTAPTPAPPSTGGAGGTTELANSGFDAAPYAAVALLLLVVGVVAQVPRSTSRTSAASPRKSP
ncbi:hypothetical protein ACFVXD_45245, partial [Kitasatospora herbaricolor]